jgi:1-deoxyxylulose-5-phosphate synthase
MKKRPIGLSTLHISELSLGCMSLPLDQSTATSIIHAAIDAGINYFDTADLYNKGQNETLVGQALKGKRQDIILATKVGNKFSADRDDWTWDPSRKHILQSVHESLNRLQTDYIDVYQLHGGTNEDNLDEVIDTFEQLKTEGLIREYGISSIRPNVFIPFSQSNAISNMMQYNMLDRSAEEYFDVLKSHGVSVLTRGTVAKGLLTDAFRNKLHPYMSYSEAELQTILTQLQSSNDLLALALRFNLQHDAVASTVVGARTVEQLNDLIRAYDAMPSTIDEDILNQLRFVPYQQHR